MTILLLIGLLLGGLYSVSSMPVESDPEVKIPIATVTTGYPGASPSDVEKLVTDKIEDRLKGLDNLKVLTSSSSESVSVIVVEFDASADLNDSIRKLRDEVETAKSDLPEEANDPFVKQIRAGDQPIITFAIVGNEPLEDMKFLAEELEDILEGISGVNKVDVMGLPEREMQVLINIQKLEGFGLSANDVAQAISANHIDFPIGSVRTNELYYQTSLKGQFDTIEELSSLVVASRDGQNIFLRDLADIREVFAERTSEPTIFRSERGEYELTIALDVYKKVGADLVDIVDKAKVKVDEYVEESFPSSLDVIITNDLSDLIKDDISRLTKSALQTTVIIAVILFLALGVKEAIAAALSIPILYLISFIVLYLIDETFNFLTFFALILSLGIAIDTSIVIIEGIHENTRTHGLDAKRAALASVATFRAPLISGTLTTVAAFLPLALMSGIMGEYVKHIPITVNITLIASLATALMILPAVAARLLRGNHIADKPALMDKPLARVKLWYGAKLERILQSKKRRRIWTLSMIVALITVLTFPVLGIVKVQMFRPIDFDFLYVDIETPEGSSLEATAPVVRKVEQMVEALPEVKHFLTVIGNGAPNKAVINIQFTKSDKRDISSITIAQIFRENIRTITEAEVTLTEAQGGPPTGSPVELRLIGDDILELEHAAMLIQAELETIEGSKDVTNDLSASPGEFHVSLKRDRLEYYGVNAMHIAQVLRTSVFGNDSVKIIRAGEETPIVVRLDFRDAECLGDDITRLREKKEHVTLCRINPQNISEIQNLMIPTPRGQVPVSELVDFSLEPAVTTIRHYDGDRVVSVKGGVLEGYVSNDILKELQKRIPSLNLDRGISVDFGGESEDIQESFNTLGTSSIIAIILIAAILVFQFESFKLVFIILFTIPLALIGVLGGLAILRFPLSFPGLIGLAALTGIVVNDAIVLIDRINTNRKLGLDIKESVKLGCEQRLEPVILTTLSTAGGMVPLIFGGRMFIDLALVVALGISFSTILTLVMVPIFYVKLETPRTGPYWFVRLIRFLVQKTKRQAIADSSFSEKNFGINSESLA